MSPSAVIAVTVEVSDAINVLLLQANLSSRPYHLYIYKA